MNIIKRAIDDSYIIQENGYPYHIPNEGEFAEKWAEINAYAEAHPEEVTIEYPPEPYEPTFAELVKIKRREIWGAGDAILAAVKTNFTEAEIESWPKQEQGAKDIKAGNTETEVAVFVSTIAQNRGIETSVLVDKILNNVATYEALLATVIGEQQRLDDLIKAAEAAQDAEALSAIVWTLDPSEEQQQEGGGE